MLWIPDLFVNNLRVAEICTVSPFGTQTVLHMVELTQLMLFGTGMWKGTRPVDY